MAIQKFELELLAKKMISPNTMHLSFKRADNLGLDYIAGQFVTFMFEPNSDQPNNGKPKRRSYSIASMDKSVDSIDIAISYIEGGIASEHLFNAEKGDKFNAMGPAGRLILKDDVVKRLILVGTGTGIAPYRAMLPTIAKQPSIKVEILLGVQYRQDTLYAEDFIEYADKYNHITFTACLSREEQTLKSHEIKGYVQSQFDDLALIPGEDVIYLCGNPDMIDEAFERLTANGFDTKSVRREKYISSN